MKKHPSGWYIADPEGLAAFQSGRNTTDRNSAPFLALVQPDRWRIVPNPDASHYELPWKWDSSINDYTYRPWVLCQLTELSDSSLLLIQNPAINRDTPIGSEWYTGVPSRTAVFPLAYMKSPARLALETLGAKL